MQNDTVLPTQPPSLFPVHLQPSVGNDGAPPEWLNNASFTTDLSVVNDSVASHYKAQRPAEEELESENEEEEVKEKKKDAGPQYELLESSASDRGSGSSSSEEEEERKSKKKRKKKKRKRNRELSGDAPPLYDYISSRKPDVRSWASSSSSAATNSKDYYFDSRGDRDNLAFGCLYRMDVARYKLYNSKKTSGLSYYRSTQKSSFFDGDDDIDSLDDKLRSGGRYWSPQYAALERHRNLKRMRVLAPEKMVSSISDDFIPLSDESSDARSPSTATTVEESWEDEMLRKTKEFNRLTRERPHDEKVWSAFSEFQDKVASMQPQKGARLQTLEKKISILEKAVELNPDNEDLILSLMKAYQNRDSTDVLIGRWEKTLMKNSGSYRLWKEFLQVVQGEFSRFKVSEMRKMFANAIRALSGACNRQYRQVHQKIAGPSVDPDLAHLEVGLVEIFLGLCRFEWQTGHQELATALMQAEIEYSLFSPSLFLSEQSKRSLFEHFWNSNAARVGEDGALGWLTWLGKEEEERQKLVSDNLSCSDEEGGWTGWSEPQSKTKEVSEILEDDRVSDMATQESSDEHDTRDVDQNDDTETLLKRLGIDTAADANTAIKDTRTWTRWSEEELRRDSDQWMPLHTSVGNFRDDAEGDEQLSRVILYEDVTDYLFSLTSEEARLSLVSQFIEFFGGRISPWTCTNSSSWTESLISSEVILYAILEQFQRVYDIVAGNRNVSGSVHIESLVNNSDDISVRTNMMKFVRNATLLCLTVFPQNHILDEAVLIAEELSNTRMNSSPSCVTPCRALAKNLLKSNRQDILLCGAYARREAAFGNIDQARKIFDMALLSTEGLPLPDARRKSSLLNFWYAEMELANSSVNSKESFYRAMHILSCLGCGVKYTPYIGQPTSLQQLRARQGFKEQIRMLRSTWTRGVIDDSSISLICSATLFEELTAGPAAGIEVLDDAFTMVLPERRRNSYQLELLFNYYIWILYKHRKELKLSKIWEAIVKGLQMYPSSPGLYGVLVEISHLHTSPNKLRWILDDYSSKKQSLVAFLFSLSFEISKGSPSHRIRAMFERGLVNGRFHNSVVVWRCYIAYESDTACDPTAARRVYFRAIHACPWSKKLWLDGFLKLNSVLTAKELSDLQEVMRDKELNLRTDIYEILLQDEMDI